MFLTILVTGCNVENNLLSNDKNSSIEENINSQNSERTKNSETIKITEKILKLENGLSVVKYEGDYGFDDFLANGGASSDNEVVKFLSQKIFFDRSVFFFWRNVVRMQYGLGQMQKPRLFIRTELRLEFM